MSKEISGFERNGNEAGPARRPDPASETLFSRINNRDAARQFVRRGRCVLLTVLVLPLIAVLEGCRGSAPQPPPAEPLVVPVSKPIQRKVADYVYYTGRTDAVRSVEVRARVTGYLVKTPFKEGTEVREGDLLFEIDRRPYQAQYDAAKAQLELYESSYKLTHAENLRSKAISRNVSGSISPEALEKSESLEIQALANVNLTKANLALAKLSLDFTLVSAPIDGQVSRYLITVGNLVTQDQTLLTTVVSVDPMYVYFDVDERTVLTVRKAINAGTITPVKNSDEIAVFMGLEGEAGYPHQGSLNFHNNAVSQATGTLTVRGVFANALPPNGRRLLSPGMFVRIQLPVGQPHQALLIAERALGSDQGAKFVYVVNSQKQVEYRRVKVGAVQDDGLRVIDDGLKPDDWVMIGGLQQVRPKQEVSPDPTAMPILEQSEDDDHPIAKPVETKAKTPSPPAPPKR